MSKEKDKPILEFVLLMIEEAEGVIERILNHSFPVFINGKSFRIKNLKKN